MNLSRSPYFPRKSLRRRHDKITLRQVLLWIGLSLVGLFLFGVLSLGITVAVLSIGLPDVHNLNLFVAQSSTIYDKDGNPLFTDYNGEENRQYVNYDQISSHLIDATVAIEDRQFWDHHGFSVRGIARAVYNDIFTPDKPQGASTITQQYIKLAVVGPEKSLVRKMKELILSVQFEQAYDKKKILELYLNQIPYGKHAYGIEKAAQIYLNKPAKDLDIAESAVLASLPNNPSYLSNHIYSTITKQFTSDELEAHPITSYKQLADDDYLTGVIGRNVQLDSDHTLYIPGRSDAVLQSMLELNYITQQQKDAASAEIQNMKLNTDFHEISKAAHFTQYVLQQLKNKYHYSEDLIEQGGLHIYTTLDPKLQDIAEKVVKDGADYNTQKYNTRNASLVAMDPKTGNILAMVGSKDFADPLDGQVNMATTSTVQPGSSFKPFVYAQAFYNRYAPASIVFDTPIQFADGSSIKNFEGGFEGPMTIRRALGQSRNIPAIKAYFAAGEQGPIIDLAEKMGLHFHELESDPSHVYGYTLALGTAEVSLLDMVTGYSTFADAGIHHDPISILKVTDSKGNVLPGWPDTSNSGQQALDPQVAYMITSILSDTSVRLGGASGNLTVPNQVNAVKTGTSDFYDSKKKVYYPKDMWTIGYTTNLAVGVWTGNNNPKRDGYPTANSSTDGLFVAAPIWKAFMTQALKDSPSENFPVPDGIQQVAVATASGKLPGPTTPSDQINTDVFASFSIPTEIDDSYTQVDIDTLCGKLANEFTPDDMKKKVTFINQPDLTDNPSWLKGAQDWLQNHSGESQNANDSLIIGAPPTETCPDRTAENYSQRPTISILQPTTGSTVAAGSRLNVNVEVNANGQQITKVEYFLDDVFKYSTVVSPYTGQIRLPVGEAKGTHHTITAKVHGQLGFTGESSVDVVTGDSNVDTSQDKTETQQSE